MHIALTILLVLDFICCCISVVAIYILAKENNELENKLTERKEEKLSERKFDVLVDMFDELQRLSNSLLDNRVSYDISAYLVEELEAGKVVNFRVYGKEPDYLKINRIVGNIDFVHVKINRLNVGNAQYVIELELIKNVGGERND